MQYLITGTSYGLGAAIAEAVVGKGNAVLTCSRTEPRKMKLQNWVRCDMSRSQDINHVIDFARATQYHFQGVVFNAAIADKSVDQWKPEQIRRHMETNFFGIAEMFHKLRLFNLLHSEVCNVVLLSSFLQNGNARQPAYAASKAALWSWMRSFTLAQTASGNAENIQMNMIWPGRVETPANPKRELPDGDPNLFRKPEEVVPTVMHYLTLPKGGPRGTVYDMGR